MGRYPLSGNGIEVRNRTNDPLEERRKFSIHLEKDLYRLVRDHYNWEEETSVDRNSLEYHASQSDDTKHSEYPLRGEGVEIRHLGEVESQKNWHRYKIYVDPELATNIVDAEPPPEPPKPPKGQGNKSFGQRNKSQSDQEANGFGYTKEGAPQEYIWQYDDRGRYTLVLSYIATDQGFEAAKNDIPCT